MSTNCRPGAWRRDKRAGGDNAGFTLIEILVAIAVLGIVMLAALGGLSAVRHTAAAIEANLDNVNNAPLFLDRLCRDLGALVVTPAENYRPPDIGDDPDPYRFCCQRTLQDPSDFARLEFASRSHLPLADTALPGDARLVSQVAYFARPCRDGGFTVLRAAVPDLRRTFVDTPPAAVVCRKVVRLSYTFEDAEGQWRPEWNSDDRLWDHATPRAAVVALELTDGARYRLRIALPISRAART